MTLIKKIFLFAVFTIYGLTAYSSVDSLSLTTSGNTICYDSCMGTALVQIHTSSIGPFQVIWKGNNLPGGAITNTTSALTDTLFNLCAGDYTVEVLDQSDASKTFPITFTINIANPLSITYNAVNPTCHDSINGLINILSVDNGAPLFHYQWSTGINDTNALLSGLGRGVYGIVITDANGCVFDDSISLLQPDTLKANISGNNITCKSACDGVVMVSPSGGTGNYSIIWSNSDTNLSVSNLCPGNFIVNITDANGCINTDSVLLTEPDSILSTYLISDANCSGNCDGEVVSVVTGGSRPYSYYWSGYVDSDSILNNACAGLITSNITDANGCYYTENISVNAPDPLSIQSTVNASTCNVCDGDISINVIGGNGPYHYLWLGQKAQDTIPTIDSLCPGIYRVAVSDNNLCSDTFSIALSDDTSGIKDVTFLLSKSSCSDVCDGSILASPLGGTAPFSYLWSPSSQIDSVINGICAGKYSVEITDATGCKRVELIDLKSESNLSASYSTNFDGCYGDCGGEIQVEIINGIGPYTINWPANSLSGNSVRNLCPGSYAFKVIDANSCSFLDTAIISSPDSIILTLDISEESCYQSCDAAVSVSASGGNGIYSYLWSTGNTSSSISNLCAGSYWVEVSDGNSCIKHEDFTINGALEIQSNLVVFDADCGINNGGAKVNPTGGTAPYTFSWFTPNNTLFTGDSVSRLQSNLSTPLLVFITDSNACTKIDSFVIADKNGPDFTYILTDESCENACDGSIEINVPNANGPIEYVWMPSFASSSATRIKGGLCEGIYYIGVKSQGCGSVKEVKIKRGNSINIDFVANGPSCKDECDASIIANVSGGIPPYSYLWSNSSSLDAVSGICSGTYSLQVLDASGCSVSKSIEIENPASIDITLSTSNLICNNTCNGTISSSVSGGSAPYTYVWSDGSTGKNLENLCAGSYWVNVTDANGCVNSDTISIGNGVPLNASFVSVNADCGDCNGSLTVSASAGNGQPYSYYWSNGDTTNSITDLAAGLYSVVISDYLGCSQEFTTYVNNNGGPSLSDTTFPASCFNSCDASAKAIAIGSNPPFLIQWNDALKQVGDSASGLCEGLNYYSATDSLGCMSFDSVLISQPSQISIVPEISNISCPGGDDGSISLSIIGGIGPISILWSTGDTTTFIDSLAQGIYTVSVTDSTGCSISDTFSLSDPTPLQITFDVTNATCFGSCDGRILAQITGGSLPYAYQWNDPSLQTTNLAAGLCTGYTRLTITDAKGCALTDSALITSPSSISATPVLSNPTCKDGDNGSISLTIGGGLGPFQVSWDNGMKGSSISGLKAGTYVASIIDANQCTFSDSYILNNPSGLNININTSPPSCGNNNGSASAVVTGGSGSYSFLWNSIASKTTSTASNLWAGIYIVTVTDNNTGCEASENVILNNAGTSSMSFTIFDETCLGNCDGELRVIPGAGNFIFQWDDLLSTQDSIVSSLCQGLYTVRVEDTSTGCVRFDTARIGSSDFRVKLLGSSDVSCFGSCDGSARIEGQGGLPPYQYSWSTAPPQLTSDANMLCGGSYYGTASDSNGCSESVFVIINEADSLVLDVNILSEILCAQSCDAIAEAIIVGGTGPYTIEWNGSLGSNIQGGLCAGANIVSVVDANGCSATLNFNVIDASPIMDNAIINLPSCSSFNGSIRLNPTGGKGPYTFQWSQGTYNNVASNLFAGIYSVVITDANACSKEFTYFLNNPNAPLLNFDKNTVKCNGDCNGVARVTPVGGVGPYAYIWDNVPVSTRDSLTDLCSGIYFVKVTDATGCIAFGADTITEPDVLDGLLNKLSDGCGGSCEGEAEIIGLGGTLPYSYSWNSTPPQNSLTATQLCAGTVQVILSDANGCEYIDSVEIIPPPALLIDSTTYIDASCFTNTDGEASVFFQGGTAPVRFLWSDGQNTQTATALGNGKISVILTDTNGCSAVDTVSIGVKDTVLVQAFVDSIVCIGNQTLLRATGFGSTSYNWFADSSGSLKSLGSGDSLYLTVEDSLTIYLRGQNDVVPPCFDLDTAYLIGIQPPVITANASKNPIEEGESTELVASPFLFNGSYAWSPAETLNDSASISPIAEPKETTTYVIIGTDEFGCFGTDTITIVVVKDNDIINGFSPNGDGVNDVWVIPALEDYPNVIVEVYSRWGEQVFQSVGYKDPWDGTYKGDLLPNASYYYVIDFFGDGERVETGAVTILY